MLGNLLGIVAAWRRGGFLDSALPPILVFVGSFPYFWLAMGALYLFGVEPRLVPAAARLRRRNDARASRQFIANVATHLVLPALTIVLVSIGGWMLGMRNTMIATTSEDYITMAEAKGLSPRGSCSATPPATRCSQPSPPFGMALGFVVGGALLTEVVFAYPGVGYQLLMAVRAWTTR